VFNVIGTSIGYASGGMLLKLKADKLLGVGELKLYIEMKSQF